MSTTITENVDNLFELVSKSEGIISTFGARDLKTEPETVENEYRRYAQTHVSLGDTGDFENKIYENVTDSDSTTKGYLYGKYGYGKTSTSVSIWNTLSDNEIIAIPPFTFDSFASIMQATYGWMYYQLDTKAPSFVDDLEDIHDRYLQQELRTVAQEGEHEHDLDAEKLTNFLEDSDFDPTITADTLIDFFNECTELAIEAGFNALVVMADELQEYFKSADNENDAESRLRQLVFGLHSGAQIRSEFGLFISMPESTKSMLDSRAEDILNRLQRDNLVLNLQNVYGRDFPTELWNRYAEQFNFEDKKHDIITEHALTAFGEVCSRNDLSNGPRTVMDLLRLALLQYRNQQEAFSALDLAEAFYQGEVRYTGSATKIQTAIGDALDNSAVDSESKQIFIKLCAVFPEEGIPEAVVEKYGLGDSRKALSKKIHGEVIKVIADGYTLVDVTKTKTDDPIREIISDFWRDYGVSHAAASEALEALANKLVNGKFLEAQRGTLDGWTNGGRELNSLDHTVYRDQFEGTFDTRYPKRRLSVGVADAGSQEQIVGDHGDLGEEFGNPDIALNFVLHWEQGGEDTTDQFIEAESEREYSFVLDGRQSFDSLPNGLDFLRDAMDPNAVTPFLMLSLVNYLDDPPIELDAQQQSRIESFQQSLLNQSVKALFDEELINNAPFELRRTGKRAVSGVFTNTMEQVYPEYSTVITSTQYRDLMEDYVDFLGTLDTTSKRRGTATVVETTQDDGGDDGKHKMAKRFGLRSTSSFDNRLKKHYSDIITIVNKDVDNYELRAELHPFEQEIVDKLESGDAESFPIQDIETLALKLGYRDEEVDILSKFIQKRGIVGMNESGNALVLQETEVTIEGVQEVVDSCKTNIETITRLDEERVPEESTEIVEYINEELERSNPEDGEKLEALKVKAEHLLARLEEAGELLYDHYLSTCEEVSRNAERARRSLIPNHLENEVTGGVQFVGGLNDARSNLLADYQGLRDDLSALITDLEQIQSDHDEASVEAAENIHQKVESARKRLDDIESQSEELEVYADELKRWRTFTDKVSNVKQDIKDYSRTFEESIEEDTRIDEIIAEISERLADKPLDALTNREAFEQRVDDTNESYQQHRDKHRNLFNNKQDTLNDILHEATGGKSSTLHISFDVKKPSESRRRLVEKFKDEYESQVLKKSKERLDSANTEVEYAQIVDVEAATDTDPDRVEDEISQARARIRQLRGSMSRFEYEDIGEETELDTKGSDLLTTSKELNDTARDFRAQSEPESEEVQDLLTRVENNRGAEFKELLMEYHEDGDQIEVDELLNRMEELFKLNQIDIRITQRRGR